MTGRSDRRTPEEALIYPPFYGFRTNIGAVKNHLIIPESGPVGQSPAELDALASYFANTYASMLPPSDPQFLFLRYAPQGLPVKAFALIGNRRDDSLHVPLLDEYIYDDVFGRLDSPALMRILPLVLSKVLHDRFGGSSIPVSSITLETVDLGSANRFNGVVGNTAGQGSGRTLNAHYFDCLRDWRALTGDYTSHFSKVKECADFEEQWLRKQVDLEAASLDRIKQFVRRECPEFTALDQSPRELALLAIRERDDG